ncbi:Neuromedin-B receptor [Trichoplax sp. H2]|nr:Neuromedin-B receptor [Trichoplax sp. H2]|eukprot:RDD39731.1 Neuromedin-B receptor [Trichoplax sp. H2]
MENINSTITNDDAYSYFSIFINCLCSIGLIANALLLYIFTSDKFFRKTTYYLMLICVISDGISNISSLSSSNLLLITKLYQSEGMDVICRLFGSVVYISYGISIMNLCLISIDRYFAFVKPLNYFYRTYKSKIIIITEVFIWIISAAVAIPDFVFIQAQRGNRFICDYPNITTSISVYLVFFSAFFYVLPSIVIIIIYWRIIIFQRNYIRPGQQSRQLQQDLENKKKLIKSLISISLCYVLTTFPYFALMFAMGLTRVNLTQIQNRSPALFILSLLAVSMTGNITIINPFLLLRFDGNIRRRFREILVRVREMRRK